VKGAEGHRAQILPNGKTKTFYNLYRQCPTQRNLKSKIDGKVYRLFQCAPPGVTAAFPMLDWNNGISACPRVTGAPYEHTITTH